MSARWHIGMEVECIDDEGFSPPLRQGAKYTITAIVPWRGYFKGAMRSFQAIELAEVRNPSDAIDPDAPRGFASLRFRPVQKRTTSIAVFTALLNPSPADKADIELADFLIGHALPLEKIR